MAKGGQSDEHKKTNREETGLGAVWQAARHVCSAALTEYEDQLVPIPDASPAMMLQYLMKNTGLRQVDLAKILNTSRGGVSSIVNGKRAVSKAQAKILADRFKVSVEAFL